MEMDIDIIRYFGAAYIMESQLPPREKCNMIDYVKEAQWDQILNLVFNGSPPSRELTVNEQYILEAQAENFIYPLIFRYMEEGKRKGRKRPTRKEKMAVAAMKRKAGGGSPTAKEASKATPKPKAPPKPKSTPKPKGGKVGLGLGVDPKTGQVYLDSSVIKKGREYAEKGSEKGRAIASKYGPGVKRFGKGAGVAVIVAAATAAGQRVYKVYLSKAARHCSNLRGAQKRDCMVKFRKSGYQAKLNSYIKAKHDCKATKNPQRCQRDLDTKIKKVKYKMGTLYSRL